MGPVCGDCGAENPDGARFCFRCGHPLARLCPSCGHAAVQDAAFCVACGAALTGAPAREQPADGPPPEERRRVTVLFADLAGYTAMSERLDPEAVKEILDRSLIRLADEVKRLDGTVDKFIGDNLMALFGAPIAHEDDAERAVRCGLAMQAAMAEINADLDAFGVTLSLRVGINTGEVLAGLVGEAYTVSGDAVNVAQRLQSAGRQGAVTVGERTFRLTRRAIAYAELEPLSVKGKAEPVAAWEALGPVRPQQAARPLRRETLFVGREDELALLETHNRRAEREQRVELVTIIGEPGVGKSRLFREFERRLVVAEQVPTVYEGRCLAYGSAVVYWALGEIVRAECGIGDGDSPEDAQHKLEQTLSRLLAAETDDTDELRARKVRLVGRLLGIDVSGDVDTDVDPAGLRERFFSAVLAAVQAMGRRGPLVLCFEDIHWADAGMLDLIEYLAHWVRAPVLIVCLARDQLIADRPGWGSGRRGGTILRLEPLREEESQQLVSGLLATRANGEMAQAVATRAGGNPLFAEEMVQRLLEEKTVEVTDLPDTVHALLAARLDALPPFERRLVQHAAVVGRTFWKAALRDVEGGDLDAGLMALEAKELILLDRTARGLGAEPELSFKHVLIRDVAYGTLPKAVRARKHFKVGRFIAERAGDRAEEFVALLAEHYGRAAALAIEARLPAEEAEQMSTAAREYSEAAGDATAALYSNLEAVAHYEAARGVTGDDRARARIDEKLGDVGLRLGRVDAALRSWADALAYCVQAGDAEAVARLHRKTGAGLWDKGDRGGAIEEYKAGINLLKEAPTSLELVRLYADAATLYMQTGDNMLAIYAAEKALRLAEQLGEVRAACRAHAIFGRVFGRMGDAENARVSLERSLALARDLDRSETVLALSELGHHLELAEASHEASEQAFSEALSLADAIGDVPRQVELHFALAVQAVYAADWARVQELADSSAGLAEREGLAGKLCLPAALRGFLSWRDGEFDKAASLFRESHAAAESAGWSEVAWAALLGLAVVQRDRGEPAAAAATLAEAVQVCERTGLAAQGVQCESAIAVTLAMAGDREGAASAARRAVDAVGRVHYPICRASAREAEGVAQVPPGGVQTLDDARALWEELGRPLDAARCELLAGEQLRGVDSAAASKRLAAAEVRYETIGIGHLATRARALAEV